MPGNTVSFMQPGAILAPDLSVEQTKLQRQYELAQALRQMSLQNDVPQRGAYSWTQGAAKIAEALAARHMTKRADEKQLAVNQAYASRLGSMFGGQPKGGDPNSTPSQASDPSAPLSGVPTQSPGASSPAQTPSPSGAGASSGPWSLTGDPQQDMAMYAMNPDKYGETVIASHAPVDMAKAVQQAQAAMARGDIATATALLQNVQKNNYIAPINGRPGSTIRDPLNPSHVIGYDAPSIEGAFPIYEGGSPVGYQQAPGAQAAIAGVAGAKAGATASAQAPYDLVTVTDAEGRSFQIPKSAVPGVGGGQGGSAPGGGLNGYYGKGAPAQGGGIPAGPGGIGVQTGIGPGQQSASTTAGTNSANGFNEAIQGGVNAQNAMRTINNLMEAGKGLPTGPTSGTISDIKSGVNAISGAFGGPQVFDQSQIAKFDEMAKNAATLGDQLSSAAGGGTDARLHNALKSLPGSHYSPQAIQEVGNNLKGLQSAALARSQAAAAWQQLHGANSYPQFQQAWQRAYNGDIFYHLQKGDVAQWSKGMSASEREHVMGQYRQMKAMGAF